MAETTEIFMRRSLGILAMLLPFVDIGFGYFWCKYVMGLDVNPAIFDSISATHYASSSLLFEGIVFTVAIFLICYRGYDVNDYWLTTVTGCAGLIVALFPTATGGVKGYNFIGLPPEITTWFHYTCAVIFFLGLAIMEIWQFTKTSDQEPTKRKKIRNIVYRVCGISMLVVLLTSVIIRIIWQVPFICYIGEGIGLEFFGFAWLVKGRTLFRD